MYLFSDTVLPKVKTFIESQRNEVLNLPKEPSSAMIQYAWRLDDTQHVFRRYLVGKIVTLRQPTMYLKTMALNPDYRPIDPWIILKQIKADILKNEIYEMMKYFSNLETLVKDFTQFEVVI